MREGIEPTDVGVPRLSRVLVADTTMFTDARLREVLGARELDEAVRIIVRILARTAGVLGVRVYVAPSVEGEMRRFMLANGVTEETLDMLSQWLIVKPPRIHDLKIPAAVFRRYVELVRLRLDRGLRVAEDHVRKACLGEESKIIRSLREKYRESTRRGIVDSVQDADTVLLAMDLGAAIVSSDEGVRWLAEELGTTVLSPVEMLNLLIKAEERLRQLEDARVTREPPGG